MLLLLMMKTYYVGDEMEIHLLRTHFTNTVRTEAVHRISQPALDQMNKMNLGLKRSNCCWYNCPFIRSPFSPRESSSFLYFNFSLAEYMCSCLCSRACEAVPIQIFTLTQIKSTGTNSMCYFRLLSFYFIRMRACEAVPYKYGAVCQPTSHPVNQTYITHFISYYIPNFSAFHPHHNTSQHAYTYNICCVCMGNVTFHHNTVLKWEMHRILMYE